MPGKRFPKSVLPDLFPVLLSAVIWGLGSAAVLFHVLAADSFVMVEVRRHGLVRELVATLMMFAIPYLVAGGIAAWTATGITRLFGRSSHGGGWLSAMLGSSFLIAFLGGSTVYGIVERPALFAGLFYLRGGGWREFQLALERGLTPPMLGWSGLVVFLIVFMAAFAGWFREAGERGRRALVTVSAVTVVGVAVWLGWGGRAPAPVADRPNVLVVLVDSLRPEVAAGDSRSFVVTPVLEGFAADAVRFRDVQTPLARTYSSVASMLTGRHPVVHGVRTIYPANASRSLVVPDLPSLLRQAGWSTVAVGGYCATVFRELDFGFEHQRTPRGEADLIVSSAALRGHPLVPVWLRWPWARALFPQARTAVEGSHPGDVAREAIAAWRASRAPFFMTVFFDNAHLPYVPVWPDSATAGDYGGPNRYSITAGNLEEMVRAGETAQAQRDSEIELANARRLYAAAVRSVDRAIGALLDALEKDGLTEETLVVVLADHGQNLLDVDGPLSHGQSMERDGSTAVPWLMRWPGHLVPGVISDAVTVMDLVPTVLDLVGIPPDGPYDGASLVERLRGGAPLSDRAVLLETGLWFIAAETVAQLDPSGRGLEYPRFDDGLLTVEPGAPVHIVVAPEHRAAVYRAKHRRLEVGVWALSYRPRRGGASFRLYRRDVDPLLTRNLADEHPERFLEMIALFYEEGSRLGDSDLLPPESANPAAP